MHLLACLHALPSGALPGPSWLTWHTHPPQIQSAGALPSEKLEQLQEPAPGPKPAPVVPEKRVVEDAPKAAGCSCVVM